MTHQTSHDAVTHQFVTDLSSCSSSRMTKMIQGMDRRSMMRLRAGLSLPPPRGLIRQSVERAPLVMVEKAKHEKVKSQVSGLGGGTFALASKLVY